MLGEGPRVGIPPGPWPTARAEAPYPATAFSLSSLPGRPAPQRTQSRRSSPGRRWLGMSQSCLKSYCSTRGFSNHPCQEVWVPLCLFLTPTPVTLPPLSAWSPSSESQGPRSCPQLCTGPPQQTDQLGPSPRKLQRGSWLLSPTVRGEAKWQDGLLVTSL